MILNGLEERKRSSSEGRPYSIQVTEVRMRAGAGSAATAAIGKHKTTDGQAKFFTCDRRAVNGAKRGHGSSP
jgi:hypothetical protein